MYYVYNCILFILIFGRLYVYIVLSIVRHYDIVFVFFFYFTILHFYDFCTLLFLIIIYFIIITIVLLFL